MGVRSLLALAALLIAAQSAQAVPQRTCQQLTQYALEHQPSQLCIMAGVLRDLGCLCGPNREAVMSMSDIDPMNSIERCFPLAEDNEALCTFPPLSDLAQKHAVFGVPGVVSLPGFGMLLVSSLQDGPATKGSFKLQTDTVPDVRPVLDLSSPLELVRQIDEKVVELLEDTSVSTEVVMTENQLASGDFAFNIDIGIPKSFLDAGGELDLEISDVADDLEITYDSDLELDVSFSSEVKQPNSGNLGREYGSLHLQSATLDNRDITQGSLDFNILPGIASTELHAADEVTIEMDIEIDGESHIHDAVITVRDEDSKYPITGLEVGGLLSEISAWLSKQLPSHTQDAAFQDSTGAQSALRGVSKLLSDVGEQIGEIMPDQELYNGQTLEIIAEEESEMLDTQEAVRAPCMFKALAQAAASVMPRKSKNEPQDDEDLKCKLCAFVDKHLAVLWCVVVAGTVYVTYTLLLSFFRYIRPSQHGLSIEEDDLQKPLILYAADFAEVESGKEDFEPYCGPDKSQASQ